MQVCFLKAVASRKKLCVIINKGLPIKTIKQGKIIFFLFFSICENQNKYFSRIYTNIISSHTINSVIFLRKLL